jgi:hypothetical protein
LLFVLMWTGAAAAGERERGFVDLYGGIVGLDESDVPDWRFADVTPVVGGRVGVWLADTWALTLRTWYFQSDAKQEQISPSDLAFLGLSLEILARWRLDDRWAVFGSLGPMLAINTLDREIMPRQEEDARSLSPGASASVGVEVRVWNRLRAFIEGQATLVYASFDFRDRPISPRLLTSSGLVGVRVPF